MSDDTYIVFDSSKVGVLKKLIEELALPYKPILWGVGTQGGGRPSDVVKDDLKKVGPVRVAFFCVGSKFMRRCGYSESPETPLIPDESPTQLSRLRHYLAPSAEREDAGEYPEPEKMWEQAKKDAPALLFADGALEQANDISPKRRAWLHLAIRALVSLANGESHGKPFELFFREQGVEYAGTGPTKFDCIIVDHTGKQLRTWNKETMHLKNSAGRTGEDEVPRIYFAWRKIEKKRRLAVVLYCGPHPPERETTYTVRIRLRASEP